MRKRIILAVAIMTLIVTGCGADNTKKSEEGKADKVNTVNVMKANASYGTDMVTLSEYNLQNGYSTIKFYNPKTDSVVVACGLANCTHEYTESDSITCNALFEGQVRFPFIYESKLYYFYGDGNTAFYESNVDGTDKKKIAEMEFEPDAQDAVFMDGNIYLTSYASELGEEDADGALLTASACSELYEVDIKTGKQKKLTNFGKKAEIMCFAKVKSGKKIYLGMKYQNKNVYESELKTWNKYMEWMGSGINTYKEALDMFDQHSEYYCLDVESNNIEKMEFNYDMTYEGMEDIKGYYDFILIGVNGQFCYYLTSYGDGAALYEYDTKKDTYTELDNSYRMYYAYANDKVYIAKTQYDPDKQMGSGDSEDKDIPPEYRCYDTNKHEWTQIEFDYDMKEKILMIEAASDKYVFGSLSSFTDDESENDSDNTVMAVGQMIGLTIKE